VARGCRDGDDTLDQAKNQVYGMKDFANRLQGAVDRKIF